MDWITGMQRAIDYIEAHITEELDYEAIAKESFSSAYHFQRVFSILCGYTLGEYIRNRRLTLAGAELQSIATKCWMWRSNMATTVRTALPRRSRNSMA